MMRRPNDAVPMPTPMPPLTMTEPGPAWALTMTEPGPAWELCVETDDDAPLTVPLAKPRYVLGRGEASDVRVNERNVSRRHAVLTCDDAGDWWVADEGSPNGTYLNGRRLAEPSRLAHGACVQLGDAMLTLRDATGAARGALVGRFEPAGAYLRDGLLLDDAPARLVVLRGPGVGSALRLDDGPVTLGGVPGSTLRLDEPGCEAVEVVVRPLADGQVEVVRRGGPVQLYVGIGRAERQRLWTNDVLRLEHDDGRMLSEVRFRESAATSAARRATELPPVGWGEGAPPQPSPASLEAELETAGIETLASIEASTSGNGGTGRTAGEPGAVVVTAGADVMTPEGPASRPSVAGAAEAPTSGPRVRDEGDAGSERRARRARWALAASLTLTLAAAAGATLWPRSPEPRTPEAAVVATRSTVEPTSAAVEPTGASAIEAPASPSTTSATARRVPAVGASGAQRVAVVRIPASQGRDEPSDPRDERTAEARVRARLESRAKAGRASAGELVQLRKLCVQQGDAACLGRLESLTRQRSELDL